MQNIHISHHPLLLHKLARLRDKNTEPIRSRLAIFCPVWAMRAIGSSEQVNL